MDGISTFSQGLKPRWAVLPREVESIMIDEDLFHLVMRIYGNWKALLEEGDMRSARTGLFVSQIEHGFRELMTKTERRANKEGYDPDEPQSKSG